METQYETANGLIKLIKSDEYPHITVEGYKHQSRSSSPDILIYNQKIQSSRSLPINLDQAESLIALFQECIELYSEEFKKDNIRFVKGKLYLLSSDWQDYYNQEYEGYIYAKPTDTGNFHVCDCWIVNANGDVHPGYAESPIPINYQSIKPFK